MLSMKYKKFIYKSSTHASRLAGARFTDPGTDTHTATWDWGDGTTSTGTVDEPSGTVTGSHNYAGELILIQADKAKGTPEKPLKPSDLSKK